MRMPTVIMSRLLSRLRCVFTHTMPMYVDVPVRVLCSW